MGPRAVKHYGGQGESWIWHNLRPQLPFALFRILLCSEPWRAHGVVFGWGRERGNRDVHHQHLVGLDSKSCQNGMLMVMCRWRNFMPSTELGQRPGTPRPSFLSSPTPSFKVRRGSILTEGGKRTLHLASTSAPNPVIKLW